MRKRIERLKLLTAHWLLGSIDQRHHTYGFNDGLDEAMGAIRFSLRISAPPPRKFPTSFLPFI